MADPAIPQFNQPGVHRSCACCNFNSTNPPFEVGADGVPVTWCGACGRKGDTCTKACKGLKWRALAPSTGK